MVLDRNEPSGAWRKRDHHGGFDDGHGSKNRTDDTDSAHLVDGPPRPNERQQDEPADRSAPEPAGTASREVEPAIVRDFRGAHLDPRQKKSNEPNDADDEQATTPAAEIMRRKQTILGCDLFSALGLLREELVRRR